MVVGKGLIASQFFDVDQDNIIFFASGVSNSSETDIHEFKREEFLIIETLKSNPEKVFIYFSTCSIYDSSKIDSPYVLHKLFMEEIVRKYAEKFLILRVSNAVGYGGNPNLLMNYLVKNIKQNNILIIHQNATRNLISVEDIKNITLRYIQFKKWNMVINVAYKEDFTIQEIINGLENVLKIKAKLSLLDLGEHYSIDIANLDYNFLLKDKNDYLKYLIEKYY